MGKVNSVDKLMWTRGGSGKNVMQHVKQMAEYRKMGLLPLLQQLELKLILNSSLAFQICNVSPFTWKI